MHDKPTLRAEDEGATKLYVKLPETCRRANSALTLSKGSGRKVSFSEAITSLSLFRYLSLRFQNKVLKHKIASAFQWRCSARKTQGADNSG